ncbi:NAD(P)/FAD-dependent oxidoreductase [Caproiciproducens sp. MSJ-32]|uniref:NAD(P)/FAD-dependent oxidoreductase n=1 Tax=Caproiciproducens sp. MSJ-32 TaxID=2841527 RepID=UPI001C128E20|nr:NAD(P)/FAD-dependent oxidoreductase [Caproiciproducens sp. MSJ-32]MBU5454290.1 NAD(P)/FAD-dependent oxidoreductase [Caproiciproducens sp. MSJ-32]
MIHHDLIIVGGGASGLIAAITAKDYGLDVAIIEATDRIGKKILTTGNGRCNISNRGISFPFINYHSENNNFFNNALASFTVQDTENFFLTLGLPIIELQNKKLYPRSLQASSVVDIFRLAIKDKNIPLYTNCKIKDVHKKKKFILSTSNDEYSLFTCNKLILACGGKSAVKTGSDGSGYNLAKSLGHSIIEPIPGIVQLKLDAPYLKAISGVKFDGYATLLVNNEVIRKEFGEILFTDYGISGPPILQISGFASRAISKGKKVEILVDMMPKESKEDVANFIENHLAIFSYRSISDSLIGIINKKLIPTILKCAEIQNIHIPCYELTWKEKNNLIHLLKEWKFNCIATNGFNQAQVTIGGVNTKEVNPNTLESKIVKDLYFCGEILDVDGDCGGFNLQWAWSSGHFVAENIYASLLNKK